VFSLFVKENAGCSLFATKKKNFLSMLSLCHNRKKEKHAALCFSFGANKAGRSDTNPLRSGWARAKKKERTFRSFI